MSPDPLNLTWSLGELPSAQHRAGLAGLVLMLRWLERKRVVRGVAEIEAIDAGSLSVRLDAEGLAALFDEVYGATRVTVERPGKEPWTQVVPAGGPLQDWDPISEADHGWTKLWRDMVWRVPRGVPAQRTPFNRRAARETTADAAQAWAGLRGGKPVDLASTLYLGAQASTAENVPFRDHTRFEILLHFQPFVWQTYLPAVLDEKSGRADYSGSAFAVVVPDVGELNAFCDELPAVLRARATGVAGYRPAGAVVDLPVLGALDLHAALRRRIAQAEGQRDTLDLVAGCEVLHFEKKGNNVRLLGRWRVEPDPHREAEHLRLRERLWCPLFRRHRLEGLLAGREWHYGFDRLVATRPVGLTIGDRGFRHDARVSFEDLEADMTEETTGTELLVYRVVGRYVARRLEQKHETAWSGVKDLSEDDPRRKEYADKRHKVARNAFLAVRGRTGAEFVEYFVGTLGAVGQGLSEGQYVHLARALHERPDEVRTLTLRARSARA